MDIIDRVIIHILFYILLKIFSNDWTSRFNELLGIISK